MEGREIAVKRLSKRSEQADLDFKNEVLIVARLEHKNLVKLLGFCLNKTERILVYEFVHNASLDYFIFGMFKIKSHCQFFSPCMHNLSLGEANVELGFLVNMKM